MRGNEWTDGASLSVSYHYHGDMEANSSNLDADDVDDAEAAASLRALRPRSSRRGSWDSFESRWSARVGGNATPSIVSGATRAASLGGGSTVGVNRAANIKIKALEQDGISVSEEKTERAFDDDMEDEHGEIMEPEKESRAEKERENTKSASVQGIIVPTIAVEGIGPSASSKPNAIQETDTKTPVVQPVPLADV